MKKWSLLLCALALLAGVSGCGGERQTEEPPAAEPLEQPRLAVEFAPGNGDAALQMRMLSPLAEKLKAALAEAGVEVKEVELTLGSSPAATGQALNQGGVDAAFAPAEVLAALESAIPLESAAWPLPSCDSGDTADWNRQAIAWTETWAAGRRVLLLAGPSEYGRNLAARAESGAELSWEELSRARWGLSGGRSDEMAALWMADRYAGKTLSNLPDATVYGSQDEALAALAAEEADAAVVIADDRIDAAEQWTRSAATGGWERNGFIWDETAVIGVTDRFYGTTLGVAGGSPWTDETLTAALMAALDSLAEDTDFTGLAGAGPLLPVTAEDLMPMGRLAAFLE